MKLLYKTSDRDRADQLMGILGDAGIETSLQGIGLSQLPGSRIPNPLTVWVVRDEDEPEAMKVLDAFFASEATTRSPAALGPPSTAKKLMPFLIALAIGAALAVVAHGI